MSDKIKTRAHAFREVRPANPNLKCCGKDDCAFPVMYQALWKDARFRRFIVYRSDAEWYCTFCFSRLLR